MRTLPRETTSMIPATVDIIDYRILSYALQVYDDDDMALEFSKMLDRCDEGSLDGSSGFIRLVTVVSRGSISETEILFVYKKCADASATADKKGLWKYAFSKIRRKLLLDFLVTAVINSKRA